MNGIDVNKLKIDMDIEARGCGKVRDGLKKCSIRGDYDGEFDIEFWDKSGVGNAVEIKWAGHIQLDDVNKKEGTQWVWQYTTLGKKDLRALIRWLMKMERRLL